VEVEKIVQVKSKDTEVKEIPTLKEKTVTVDKIK
jgi:hypothetical protein